MGEIKHLLEVESLFKRSPVVSFDSIEKTLKNGKKQYARHLIRNLLLKGKIKKLAKGWYTQENDSSLAVFCFQPAYFGLQDALSFYGIWEQETIPIIITTKRVKPGIRKVMGGNVLVRRIKKEYFFGFESLEQNKTYLPYSDIEKTLIDLLYFKENISKEALNCIVNKMDAKIFGAYLKRYPKKLQRIMKGRLLNLTADSIHMEKCMYR